MQANRRATTPMRGGMLDSTYEEPGEYSYGQEKDDEEAESGGDVYYNMRNTIGGKIEAEAKKLFKKKGGNNLDALELGDYTLKKKKSPKKKSAKKKETLAEYTTEKERMKDSINLVLKKKAEKL